MAVFTGTTANDDFAATAGADTFRFGENEGVDVIGGFDVGRDLIRYTDSSVDGFDDIDITRFTVGGVTSTAIESNDQITVLYGVGPYALRDANFAFTDGDRGTIDDARDPDDIDDIPDDLDIGSAAARGRALGGGGGTPLPAGAVEIDTDRFAIALSVVDGQGDSELVARIFDGAGVRLGSWFVREDSELNFDPALSGLGNGRFAVAWVNQDDDDPEEVQVLSRVLEYDNSGLRYVSGEAGFGFGTRNPDIASLEDGGFVIVYAAGGGIAARLFGPAGAPLGGPVVVAAAADLSVSPQVTASDDGGFSVAFADVDGNPVTLGFDADGTPLDDDDPAEAIIGSGAADALDGTAAGEEIFGLGGDDTLAGRAGDDLVFGGAGDDRLSGNLGDDLLFGEAGNDRLSGQSGAEYLSGGTGDDTLLGQAGNDILLGEDGDDVLSGGSGADVFILADSASRDRDVITDFEDGIDYILVDSPGVLTFSDLDIEQSDADTVIRFGDDAVILRDTAVDSVSEADFIF